MFALINALYRDDAAFIVSAELMLVATIGVLAMIVGLAEVSYNVNEEMEDVGSSFGHVNQGYSIAATSGHKACTFGSSFTDRSDFCDGEFDISCNGPIRSEGNGYGGGYGNY